MSWNSVKDELPSHRKSVIVKMEDGSVGIADYDPSFDSWYADDSAYLIDVSDDSGLNVSLYGQVTHWMEIPKLMKD